MQTLLRVGWLDDLTNWLRQQVERLFDGIVDYFTAYALFMLETLFDAAAAVLEMIPVPEFMTQYSLGQFFAMMPPEILYFVGVFNLAEGLSIIGAGYGFRLLRKLLTLGQW